MADEQMQMRYQKVLLQVCNTKTFIPGNTARRSSPTDDQEHPARWQSTMDNSAMQREKHVLVCYQDQRLL